MRFSRFKLDMSFQEYSRAFSNFRVLMLKVKYPIRIFYYTQTDIRYQIQQRVSILLNSLEGLIKTLGKEFIKEKKIDKSQRDQIMEIVMNGLNHYYSSHEFRFEIENLKLKDSLKDYIEHKIKQIILNLPEYTFDEVLDKSKLISSEATRFAMYSKIVNNFWWKCKRHRNFFAHLTEKEFKGFDGSQSVYVMYILSNYYRLIVLEFIEAANSVSISSLTTEVQSIDKWSKEVNMTII